MAVKIGSARSDERGKITGGKAGDQKNGKEVSTQNWYKHSKGWRVFVCKIPEMRPIMADLMQQACDNNNIGYDQYQRTTLSKLLPAANYIIKNVKTKCETDCSRLVIDIINCAFKQLGIDAEIPNGNTSTLPNLLLRSGFFEEWKGGKYTDKPDFLPASTILNTETKGHVVMTITAGDKAEAAPTIEKTYSLGDRILRNGMEGADVKELQSLLIQLDYDLGKWGADGDFGDATEQAVRALQKKAGITVDGEFGPASMKALETALKVEDGDGEPVGAKNVRIKGGNCFVREKPDKNSNSIGVAYEGKLLPWLGEKSVDGWLSVDFNGKNGWVSGKYGKLEV